jgi:cell division protein FtsQ
MWRKVLNITSWVILGAYLGVSLWFTGQQMNRLTLHDVVVNIADSQACHFITPAEVTGFLDKQGIRTTGNRLRDLNRDQVKNTVKSLSGVKDALVYTTPDGTLWLMVSQRTPVMRYISPWSSYYIDSDGREMALSDNWTARVLTVTGPADKEFLKDSLFNLVVSIRDEEFYDALIEEIVINPDHTLEMIPRVGDQRIFFGDLTNFDWKLKKLQVFYHQGLPNTGWNTYSRIDLRYSNQIVARKWSKEERQLRDSVRYASDTLVIVKPKKKV